MSADPYTAPSITKMCAQCGVEFTYEKRRGHALRRFCSAACRNAATVAHMKAERAARHQRQPFACRNCGTVVDPAHSIGRPKSVFCSGVCKEAHREAQRRLAPKPRDGRPCRYCGAALGPERRAEAFCSSVCKEAHREARMQAGREDAYGGRMCKVCGKPLPLRLKGDAVTCSRLCSDRYANSMRSERARLARSERPRPPCSICGAALAPERRRNARYCSEACKRIAVAKTYRAKHPDAGIQARYQMRPGDYEAILTAQGGQCAICGATEPGGRAGRFHVDHDHTTGRIRGLLCHGCNLGIGLLRDDPDVMRAAIAYLERISRT